jgi:hypothetical protein
MRILLDAQLPQSLVRPLEQLGCDVLHTLDLPEGNRTADNLICSIADRVCCFVFCIREASRRWRHSSSNWSRSASLSFSPPTM